MAKGNGRYRQSPDCGRRIREGIELAKTPEILSLFAITIENTPPPKRWEQTIPEERRPHCSRKKNNS